MTARYNVFIFVRILQRARVDAAFTPIAFMTLRRENSTKIARLRRQCCDESEPCVMPSPDGVPLVRPLRKEIGQGRPRLAPPAATRAANLRSGAGSVRVLETPEARSRRRRPLVGTRTALFLHSQGCDAVLARAVAPATGRGSQRFPPARGFLRDSDGKADGRGPVRLQNTQSVHLRMGRESYGGCSHSEECECSFSSERR